MLLVKNCIIIMIKRKYDDNKLFSSIEDDILERVIIEFEN